jgi:hypothetical protein
MQKNKYLDSIIKYVLSIFISIKRRSPLLRIFLALKPAVVDTRNDLLGIQTRPGFTPRGKAKQKSEGFRYLQVHIKGHQRDIERESNVIFFTIPTYDINDKNKDYHMYFCLKLIQTEHFFMLFSRVT